MIQALLCQTHLLYVGDVATGSGLNSHPRPAGDASVGLKKRHPDNAQDAR